MSSDNVKHKTAEEGAVTSGVATTESAGGQLRQDVTSGLSRSDSKVTSEDHGPAGASPAASKQTVGNQAPQKNKPTPPFPQLHIDAGIEPYDPEFAMPRAPRLKAVASVLGVVVVAISLAIAGEFFLRSIFLPSEKPVANTSRLPANR
ncbi:MAG: hypothetical protein N2Z21_05915 [Candidatus Sumerlaeaceae bacterium]|nr:hypothetical protein [Candidatus Sumerlaeaceae bacterium]